MDEMEILITSLNGSTKEFVASKSLMILNRTKDKNVYRTMFESIYEFFAFLEELDIDVTIKKDLVNGIPLIVIND